MIRAVLGNEGSPVKTVIFGLSRRNIENLMAGHPIFKEMKDMDFPNLSIAIFFGETEDTMREDFKTFIKTIGGDPQEVDQRPEGEPDHAKAPNKG
jgi:hypothetical protein